MCPQLLGQVQASPGYPGRGVSSILQYHAGKLSSKPPPERALQWAPPCLSGSQELCPSNLNRVQGRWESKALSSYKGDGPTHTPCTCVHKVGIYSFERCLVLSSGSYGSASLSKLAVSMGLISMPPSLSVFPASQKMKKKAEGTEAARELEHPARHITSVYKGQRYHKRGRDLAMSPVL